MPEPPSREDDARITDLIRALGDEESERRTRLGPLLESIERAQDANPAGWSLTVNYSRRFLNLNVGRAFVHRLFPDQVWLTVEAGKLDPEIRRDLDRRALAPCEEFGTLPGIVWFRFRSDEDLQHLWPTLRSAHFAAIERAAKAVARTPYFTAHSPTLAAMLGEKLDREIPHPDYGEGTVTENRVTQLLELLRSSYPDWDGFSNPAFVADEIEYKQASVAKARELLGRQELEQLVEQGDFETFLERVEAVARDNNLLFISVPLQGDINVLYQPDLDKAEFCRAFFDLLHGAGDGPERLGRYLAFVEAADLPSKWTFPTYFLYLCDPENEIFVKPEITTTFVRFLGRPEAFRGKPTPTKYAFFRDLAVELSGAFSAYQPRDMVDIQSLVWVCGRALQGRLLDDGRRGELRRLFQEFLSSYPRDPGYERHVAGYAEGRTRAVENYQAIVVAADRGEDVTDRVLLQLLPHADTESNRSRGAWIHLAPAVNKDVKTWFEGAGWVRPQDWPAVARALLTFFRSCIDDPGQLEDACRRLGDNPLVKGFQSGMLSPLLNALAPESFGLFNSKSRRLVNYLTRGKLGQALTDYPRANETLLGVVREVRPILSGFEGAPDLPPGDLFDMFSHWLAAVKKFSYPDERYWKIAPGERAAEWDAWRDGGYMAIGWSQLGDVGGMSRKEFNRRRDQLVAVHDDWNKTGADQVWKFAHIKEGDLVVANRGTSEAVGVGTVTGPYFFAPGQDLPHRLPVDWHDTRARPIDQPGWRRTLIEIDRETFDRVEKAPVIDRRPSAPGVFSRRGFELLEGLRRTPRKEYYLERKEEFQREIEEPFKGLFRRVVERLPNDITQLMETEKNVFSRILKNDWGRGGAWDFYWGALYRRGGQRIQDAQLFISIHADMLDYGFFVGRYGTEQRRKFLRNLRENRSALETTMASFLGEGDFYYGPRRSSAGELVVRESDADTGWRRWLEDLEEEDVRVGGSFDRKEVETLSPEDLAERIASAFRQLFPLALLAIEDEPMPAITAYLEPDDEIQRNPDYGLDQCAAETHFEVDRLESWLRAIERKGQAILYGPPGTGKTYLAERLARHLVAGGRGFVELVQLHPSYAYEDFIQGIRPALGEGGQLTYRLVKGRFREFCQLAERAGDPCVLIIDEINRANLSRVFGELMYLLEYRDQEVPLAGGDRLRIPENVRLLGTMNTADRSIALVDHALRRRFAFLPLAPDYGVLRRYHEDKSTGFPVTGLIDALRAVNDEIGDHHYQLGISFFLREELVDEIEDIWRMEVEPYLEEYFFDQPDKVSRLRWDEVSRRILG